MRDPQSLNESAAHPPRGLSALTGWLPPLRAPQPAGSRHPTFSYAHSRTPRSPHVPVAPVGERCPETLPPLGTRSLVKESYPRYKATPAPETIFPRSRPRVWMEVSHLITREVLLFSLLPKNLLCPSEVGYRCTLRDWTITWQSGGAVGCDRGFRIHRPFLESVLLH